MAPTLWATILLSILLFLASAKTHGRQMRLEREQRGHDHVTFGAGTNPPWVEGLWRRDRIRFWGLASTLALAALAATTLAQPLGDALPMARSTEREALAFGLTATLLWAPTLTFLALAGLSLARLRRDSRTPGVPQKPPSWLRHADRGSLLWLTLDAALLALVAGLTYA